jgi:hypothetical protein
MAVNLSFIGGAGWQFFDDNGDMLSGGKIYTYAAGTTTPLTTYTSRDATTPNANPIILDAAGRTPQQIWATEGSLYKYVVRTSSDVLIRTWDNIGGSAVASDLATILAAPTGATQIGFTGFKGQVGTVADIADNDGSNWIGFAFTGGTARSIQDKLQESVSPEDFGAIGDGVVDDSPSVIAALQYSSDTGVPFVARGAATYRMATQSTVNRTNGKAMTIDWAGATVVCDETSGVVFVGPSTAYLNTTLATEIDRDDSFIHLTSVAGIVKGDLIEVLSPALTNGTVSTYHYYVVNELDGNDVYIEGTTVADVKNQQIIDSGQTGSITVAAYKMAPLTVMKNATFQMINTTGSSYFCAYFRWHSNVIVNNITFTGKGRFQLGCDYTGQVDVGNCTFRDFGYVEKNSGYGNLPSAPGGLSFGYGLLITRVWQTLFHDCVGLRGWHTVDFARGAMKSLVSDCSFSRNSFGVSTHEGSWYAEVRGCMFDGNNGVYLVRAAYGVVEGCHFKGLSENAIVYGDGMIDVRISNNKFEFNPNVANVFSAIYQGSIFIPSAPEAGVVSTGFVRTFECVGNTIVGQCRCYAGFSDSSSGNLVVANNRIFSGANFTGIFCGKQTQISGNTFSDITNQFAMNVFAGSGNPSIVIAANNHTGGTTPFAASALVALSGSNSPVIHLENNSTLTQYILRFDSNLTVKSVVNCVARAERLFLNAGTVTNAINNYYVIGIASTTTVTNSVNNQALT